MSKSKYKDAWKKGFDSGAKLQRQRCIFGCDKNHDEYDKGYEQGRADTIEEVESKIISFHTDAIFRYGVDIIEGRADAFDELKDWLKKQNS